MSNAATLIKFIAILKRETMQFLILSKNMKIALFPFANLAKGKYKLPACRIIFLNFWPKNQHNIIIFCLVRVNQT